MGAARLSVRCLAVLSLVSAILNGASIVPVGVLGNSGEAGDTLYLAAAPTPLYSGAMLDSSSTLWLSAGDAVVRVGVDGKVIDRFAIAPPGSYVDSTAFAPLRGSFYFIVKMPSRRGIFRLPMTDGAVAHEVAAEAFQALAARDSLRLSAQTLNG